MKKYLVAVLFLTISQTVAEGRTYREMFGADPDYTEISVNAILKTLDFKQGKIDLHNAGIQLDVPSTFYYLNHADSTKVLVNLWGNLPQSTAGNLGMIFPAKSAPEIKDTWGSTIEYSDEGYVSDKDAESTDYDALLKTMQASTQENNVERLKQGYEPIKLVGWASPPHYEKSIHTLHWARDLLFGSDPKAGHTLNYSVRILGRKGVLEMNFISGLDQLDNIRRAIPAAIKVASFSKGNAYSDHTDGDKIAAYSLVGLIAACAGVNLAAKAGFFAVALLFLKKFSFFFVIAAAIIGRFAIGLFGRKKDPSA